MTLRYIILSRFLFMQYFTRNNIIIIIRRNHYRNNIVIVLLRLLVNFLPSLTKFNKPACAVFSFASISGTHVQCTYLCSAPSSSLSCDRRILQDSVQVTECTRKAIVVEYVFNSRLIIIIITRNVPWEKGTYVQPF